MDKKTSKQLAFGCANSSMKPTSGAGQKPWVVSGDCQYSFLGGVICVYLIKAGFHEKQVTEESAFSRTMPEKKKINIKI